MQEVGLGLASCCRWTSPGDSSGEGLWDIGLAPNPSPSMESHTVGVEGHFQPPQEMLSILPPGETAAPHGMSSVRPGQDEAKPLAP